MTRPTMEQRFWSKVDKTGDCWLWMAHRIAPPDSGRDYGCFFISKQRGKTTAHRVSYEMAFGPIPEGLDVCHRCDNPPCVRPEHLFVGTPSDNARDMVSKGRNSTYPGALSPKAKLTELDVRFIRTLHPPIPQADLAVLFRVAPTTVRAAINRQSWTSLASEETPRVARKFRCRHCGAPFERRFPKGVPPTYCSGPCQRAERRARLALAASL